MVRSARILLLLAALGATATITRAQAPELPAPKPSTSEDATAPGAPPLQLPGQPMPVISAGPPTPTFAPVPPPGPYFQDDPLLDRPPLPPPGWFADLDIGAVIPHIKNHVQEQVALPGAATTVALPSAGLDWTVFPASKPAIGFLRASERFRCRIAVWVRTATAQHRSSVNRRRCTAGWTSTNSVWTTATTKPRFGPIGT